MNKEKKTCVLLILLILNETEIVWPSRMVKLPVMTLFYDLYKSLIRKQTDEKRY